MSGIYLLRPIRAAGMDCSHRIHIAKEVASAAVRDMDVIYVRPPYTTGKDDVCIEFTVHLVQDLLTITQGRAESIKATTELKEQMDRVKGQLVVEDIESVMGTVRDMVTDEAWDKIQTQFVQFLHDVYCKDFFEDVCLPVKMNINTLPDDVIFTQYQVLLGHGSMVADAVKDIIYNKDTSEMLSKRCFIQYYGTNNNLDTPNKIMEGLIISSFIQASTA